MAEETRKLRVHGVPQPKGTNFLKEVKVDATRNAILHLKRQAEQREFEEAKARGVTPEQLIKEGVKDLESLDPGFRGEAFEDTQDFSDFEEEEQKDLDETGEEKKTTKKGSK